MATVEYFKNRSSSNKALQMLSIVLVIALFIVTLFSLLTISNVSNRVYIVDKSYSVQATGVNDKDNPYRNIEVKNHVRLFFGYMFSFNQYNYQENQELALELIGDQGIEIVKDRSSRKWYQRLRQTNTTVYVKINDVQIKEDTYPYQVFLKGEQIFQRPNKKAKIQPIQVTCTVTEYGRGEQNPHGLLIDKIKLNYAKEDK